MKNTHLPTGWQEAKLRDILFISSKKYDPQKNKTNYKCIELEHIESDTGILKGYINSNDQLSIKNIFENGDILYGKLRPYLRKFHNAKFNGVCSSEIWVLKGKKVINEFLYYFIQSYKFDHIANISCGTKMPRADWSYMSEINFIIPPLEEQKRIAEVLSLCDEVIENLTELIEKKEQYKKGVMQRLLSGEVRFKGFTDEWKNTTLNEVIKEKTVKNKNNKINLVLSVTNKDGFVIQNEFFGKTIASKDLSNYKIVDKWDFAYNPARVNVGSISMLENFDVCIVSPMYVVFSINHEIIYKYFLKYWIQSHNFNGYIKSLSAGSVRSILSFDAMSTMKIKVPSLEEQKKIAGLLSVIDEEIENLKKQLELRKQQKKGLMQKLLTGEVRI